MATQNGHKGDIKIKMKQMVQKKANNVNGLNKNHKLPENWKWAKLGDIIKLEYGKSLPDKNRIMGKYPVFGSNGIIDYHIKYFVKGPGIIIGRKGTIGEVSWSDLNFWPIDTTYFVKTKKNDISLKWLFLEIINSNIKKLISSDVVPGLNRNDAYSLQILIPPFPEQKKIAEILETVDNAIEKTDRIIEKYKRIKQGLMQDLLTRGIDENGQIRSEKTHKFKDSPLGRIPEEWDVVELENVVEILLSNVDKKIFPNEIKVKLCNYLEVYQNEYITLKLKFSNGSVKKNEYVKFKIDKGDVIITKDSETFNDIAKPAFVKDEIQNLICGYHLCLLKSRNIDGLFLSKILIQNNINKHFQKLANGITRFGITKETIQKAKIPLPSYPEQKRISSTLSQIDHTIVKEQEYKEKLERIKQGLMADLLTGKVRVNHLIKQEVEI